MAYPKALNEIAERLARIEAMLEQALAADVPEDAPEAPIEEEKQPAAKRTRRKS